MSDRTKVFTMYCLGLLTAFAGILLVLNAAVPSNTVVKVKARFISGSLPGIDIPNNIVNDDPSAYYENVGNNILEVMDSSKQGRCLYLTIITDQFSSRSVDFYFNSVASDPGQNLPSYCAMPYFIYPQVTAPIGTVKFHMKVSGGEWDMVPDPGDPNKIPTFMPTDRQLNFLTMADGQEAFVYINRFYFDVPDLPATRKVDESRVDYWFADCLWAKVKASDWDGTKVNTWTFSPVTEPFKHRAWDGSETWCYHPEGALPYMIYSNASLSCNHGRYRMPWQLEATRRQ